MVLLPRTDKFAWHDIAANLNSSYKVHRLGWWFYALVSVYRPRICVEIGLLEGFSAIYTLAALKDNDFGRWYGYDLFDDYPYNRADKKTVIRNIELAGVVDYVGSISKANATEVPVMYGNGGIDFLHIDISNTGDTFLWAANNFFDKMSPGGFMVLEGGSPARDQNEWMTKYQKPKIDPVIPKCVKMGWELFSRINQYPSLTTFRKPE